jgi:hypothetical protein
MSHASADLPCVGLTLHFQRQLILQRSCILFHATPEKAPRAHGFSDWTCFSGVCGYTFSADFLAFKIDMLQPRSE